MLKYCDMNTVITTPFDLPKQRIQAQLSIKLGSRFESNLIDLFARVEEIAKPKAIYRVSYIENRDSKTITIENVTFHSQTMSTNMKQIGRVFPFIATCGVEIDTIDNELGDILTQYWLNTIKLTLLSASIEHLKQTLQKHYHLENLSVMNPGSGDAGIWPLEEQQFLFALFGGPQIVEQEVGVQLQPSYLMVPEMSVSGILFPNETNYNNCQLCQRENCPSRQAHFDATLWEQVHRFE